MNYGVNVREKTSSRALFGLPLSMSTMVLGSAHNVARDSLMPGCRPKFTSLIWSILGSGAATGALMVTLYPCMILPPHKLTPSPCKLPWQQWGTWTTFADIFSKLKHEIYHDKEPGFRNPELPHNVIHWQWWRNPQSSALIFDSIMQLPESKKQIPSVQFTQTVQRMLRL